MILTLSDIKQSNIPRALGVCEDDPKLLQYINEAQERLMSTAKDWIGTWQSARFVITAGDVIWPLGVLEIRNAKICGSPMILRNSWYEYVQPVGEPYEDRRTGCFLVLQDQDWAPVVTNILITGNVMRIFAGSASDYGKRVLVQGYNANNIFVRSNDGGTWVDGEYVTLQSPFVDTVNTWYANGITGIQKGITNQPVTLMEVSADNGSTTEMAVLDPSDPNPRFKRSRIVNFSKMMGMKATGCCSIQMECVVKRAHIPVRVDSDYLVLQNLAAFKDACLGVKREELEGPGSGAAYFRSAEKLLAGEFENVLGRKVHVTADYHGGQTFYRGVMAGMR